MGLTVSGRQQWLRHQSLGYEQARVQMAGTAMAVVPGAPGQLMWSRRRRAEGTRMHQGVVWRPEDCSSQPSSSAIQVLGLKLSLLGLVASSFTCGAVLLTPDLDSLSALFTLFSTVAATFTQQP